MDAAAGLADIHDRLSPETLASVQNLGAQANGVDASVAAAISQAEQLALSIANEVNRLGPNCPPELRSQLSQFQGAIAQSRASGSIAPLNAINTATLQSYANAADAKVIQDNTADVMLASVAAVGAEQSAEAKQEKIHQAEMASMYNQMYADNPEMAKFMSSGFAQAGLNRANQSNPALGQAIAGLATIEHAAPTATAELTASMAKSTSEFAEVLKIHEPDRFNANGQQVDPEGNVKSAERIDQDKRLNATMERLKADAAAISKYAPFEAQKLEADMRAGKFNGSAGIELLIKTGNEFDAQLVKHTAEAVQHSNATMDEHEKALLIKYAGPDAMGKMPDVGELAKKLHLDPEAVMHRFNTNGKHMEKLTEPEQAMMVEIRRQGAADLVQYTGAMTGHLVGMMADHGLSPKALEEMKHLPADKKVAAFQGLMNNVDPANLPPELRETIAIIKAKTSPEQQAQVIDKVIDGALKGGSSMEAVNQLEHSLHIDGAAGDKQFYTLAEKGATEIKALYAANAKVATNNDDRHLTTQDKLASAEATHEHGTLATPQTPVYQAAMRQKGSALAYS